MNRDGIRVWTRSHDYDRVFFYIYNYNNVPEAAIIEAAVARDFASLVCSGVRSLEIRGDFGNQVVFWEPHSSHRHSSGHNVLTIRTKDKLQIFQLSMTQSIWFSSALMEASEYLVASSVIDS